MHVVLLTCPPHGAQSPAPGHPARHGATGLAALALLLTCGPGHAAGGHHAVDDATMLEPGQCQVEAWTERQAGDQLQHFGPACHLFGLEAGLHLDRNVTAHRSAPGTSGLQLKWAREAHPGLAYGLLWTADWQNGAAGAATQAVVLPLTWQWAETLALHVNVGREFRPHAATLKRQGVALEWQPSPHWQVLAEAWRDATPLHRRVGLRYVVSDNLCIDLSRATARGGEGPPRWALGLNWAFSR